VIRPLCAALLALACGKPTHASRPTPAPDAAPAPKLEPDDLRRMNAGPPPIRYPDAKGTARVSAVVPKAPAPLQQALEQDVAPKLEKCYFEELRRTDPALAGDVKLELTVGPDGKIRTGDATFAQNSSIEACAVNSVFGGAKPAPDDQHYEVTITLAPTR
jgi:hypothetical protein